MNSLRVNVRFSDGTIMNSPQQLGMRVAQLPTKKDVSVTITSKELPIMAALVMVR